MTESNTGNSPLRVMVAGLGNMGKSHALAYHHHPGFEICTLVNRSLPELPEELAGYPLASEFHESLLHNRPDVVSINTYTDTHAEYAVAALEQGAHVFLEKPVATTVADAKRVVDAGQTRENWWWGISFDTIHPGSGSSRKQENSAHPMYSD